MNTRRPKVPRATDGGSVRAQAAGARVNNDGVASSQRNAPEPSASILSASQSRTSSTSRAQGAKVTLLEDVAETSGTKAGASAKKTTGKKLLDSAKRVATAAGPGASRSASTTSGTKSMSRAAATRDRLAAASGATKTKAVNTKTSGKKPSGTESKNTKSTRAKPVSRGRKTPVDPRESRAQQRSTYSRGIRKSAPVKPASASTRPPRSGGRVGKDAAPVPARTFSGRIIALVLVLITAAVFVAPAFRVYMEQQGEIAQVNQSIADQQRRQDQLNAQIKQWQDQNFVIQQARGELNMVNPGERQYIVKGAEGIEDEVAPPAFDGPTDLPWADAFWESVKRAATAP